MMPHVPTDASSWRTLFDALPQIVWIARPDGGHVHFNRRWVEFTGVSLETGLENGWNAVFHPEDRAHTAARWAEATRTGEPYEIEYRLRRHDGHYRWMLGRALPVHDEDGTILRWVGTCTDIEEMKGSRAALERTQRLQQIAGAAARVGGWSIDLATDELYWSPVMYRIYELPEDHDLELPAAKDHYLPASRVELDAALDACIEHGTPFDLELQLRTATGQHRWVRAIGESTTDPVSGQATHLFGALQDITRRKATALANEELAQRLSITLESITDGFFTLDPAWRFTYLNGVAAELLQRDRDELLGADMWEEFAEGLGTEAETAYRRAARDGVPVTLEDFHFHPLDRWFEVDIFPSEQGLAVSFRDVTERRRDRLALTERVKEAKALATISRDAATLVDAEALTAAVADNLRTAMRQPADISVRVVLGDISAQAGGAPITGTPITGTPITGAPVTGAPIAGTPTLEIPIQGDLGTQGTITIHDHTGTPLLREEEALVATVAETLRLWTERRRTAQELEAANAQLTEANRSLAAAAQLKDDLLSMASHELRTPLTPIIGFLELLETRGASLETAQQTRMIASMRRHARRMLRLVDDLLISSQAAAKVLEARPVEVDPREVIAPILEEVAAHGPLGAIDLDLDGVAIHVDPFHLQQMLSNLLSNAAKYGAPPVTIRATVSGPARIALEVADRGPGVPDDFLERMWDRFEQQDRGDRRTSQGAGLGLAIVKLLAEANRGTVGYRHGDPDGATFVLDLPGRPT